MAQAEAVWSDDTWSDAEANHYFGDYWGNEYGARRALDPVVAALEDAVGADREPDLVVAAMAFGGELGLRRRHPTGATGLTGKTVALRGGGLGAKPCPGPGVIRVCSDDEDDPDELLKCVVDKVIIVWPVMIIYYVYKGTRISCGVERIQIGIGPDGDDGSPDNHSGKKKPPKKPKPPYNEA